MTRHRKNTRRFTSYHRKRQGAKPLSHLTRTNLGTLEGRQQPKRTPHVFRSADTLWIVLIYIMWSERGHRICQGTTTAVYKPASDRPISTAESSLHWSARLPKVRYTHIRGTCSAIIYCCGFGDTRQERVYMPTIYTPAFIINS